MARAPHAVAQQIRATTPVRPRLVSPDRGSDQACGISRLRTPASGNQAMQRALKPGVLQAKLTINQPGDVYEQEADRVAAQVMSTPASEGRRRVAPGVHSSGGCVQRMCKECEEEQKTAPTVQRMCSHCAEEIKH